MLILELLGALDGVSATVKMGWWVTSYVRSRASQNRAAEMRQLLEDLAVLTEPQIREMVEDWASTRKSKISASDREELIAVLTNLARGARFLTTQGLPRSSYLKSERLIEQLLQDLKPAKHRGEPVSADQDWVLERFLGMGTFGEVWMARNPYFPKPRAYKFFTKPGASEWVRKEQQTLYQVRTQLGEHPNIVQFEDVALEHQNPPYVALEYAGGGSLEDWILEDPAERVALDVNEVLLGLADALSQAHSKGISHRDLKPANVVLAEGLKPLAKITDFGLGKVVAHAGAAASAASAHVTQAALAGTSMYLPPEAQSPFIERDPAKDDVFALGVVWYQLLVDKLERPPYDFAEQLRQHDVDSHSVRLISRCLARPENRFANAVDLRSHLADVGLEIWRETPAGLFDVQPLFREYHAGKID
jgi:serine/threonine protein kinase